MSPLNHPSGLGALVPTLVHRSRGLVRHVPALVRHVASGIFRRSTAGPMLFRIGPGPASLYSNGLYVDYGWWRDVEML